MTLNGQLRYSRNILRPADPESKQKLLATESTKSVVPLDSLLGLDKLPFKMTLATMLRAAYWAQNQCSYQKAEEIMKDVYGIFINDDTIRLTTNYIGEIIFKKNKLYRRRKTIEKQMKHTLFLNTGKHLIRKIKKAFYT
jgi:hypothetical protein